MDVGASCCSRASCWQGAFVLVQLLIRLDSACCFSPGVSQDQGGARAWLVLVVGLGMRVEMRVGAGLGEGLGEGPGT